MTGFYIAGVATTIAAHFAYLMYLPVGGCLALRWPSTLVLHVPAVLWGVGVVSFGLPCPLTWLEQRAHARTGLHPLPASGFVDHYLAGVCYPVGRTGTVQDSRFHRGRHPLGDAASPTRPQKKV